jgi:hypothetical protein
MYPFFGMRLPCQRSENQSSECPFTGLITISTKAINPLETKAKLELLSLVLLLFQQKAIRPLQKTKPPLRAGL